MKNNSRLALSRVNLRDSFVMPQTVDVFVSNLSQFAETPADQAAALEEASRESLESAYSATSRSEERKPFVFQDGLAIIPVHGALLNRFGGSWGFATGYNAIRRQMNAALADDDVELLVFDVDSPGGEAAGCFELAEEIRASREIKPSIAVVDSLSASAGYALASAATRMVATPSSKIGSIGVVAMHIDMSGALDQAGIKVTLIEAPKDGMKTAGSPFRPLDADAKKEFQQGVDKTYDSFVELVAENRDMDDAAVRETKARVFRADEALALGLIDEVKTPTEAVSSFLAELADDEPNESEDEDMSKQTGSEATSTAPAPAAAPAVPDQAAIQAAIQADRERMSAIKGLPEAADKPKLAETLCLGGYSVEESKKLLGAAASETAAALPEPKPQTEAPAAPVDQTNHLANAMDSTAQPNVGAGTGTEKSGTEAPSDADQAKAILADHAAATGRRYEQA